MVYLTDEQVKRFHSSYRKTRGCWVWTGSLVKDRGGYGRFHANGKSYRAHRLSWQLHHGRWPGNLFVCHKCDNPRCVRPDHLFLGTTDDNMADMVSKGRKPSQHGEAHPSNKLKEKNVLAIRKAYRDGVSQADLHRKYGMSRAAICLIVQKKLWSHI